jgi:hypothetical protein
MARIAADPEFATASGKCFQSNGGKLIERRSSKMSYDKQRARKLGRTRARSFAFSRARNRFSSADRVSATGHYSDGTTRNLTSLVGWQSFNPSVAAITGPGRLTMVGNRCGNETTTITATYQGVVGSALLRLLDSRWTAAPLPSASFGRFEPVVLRRGETAADLRPHVLDAAGRQCHENRTLTDSTGPNFSGTADRERPERSYVEPVTRTRQRSRVPRTSCWTHRE